MNNEYQLENVSSRITLRKINRRNLREILSLNVKPRQRSLVASNAVSIAEAHFTRGAWYRAIYLDQTPIGFVMLKDNSLKFKKIKSTQSDIHFWRFMIDGRYQGKGYGRRAMELVIEYAKSRPNVKVITLHHEPSKGNAGEFYEKLGFKHTGRMIEGELEMRLELV
ncbi:MAG: GNAT family N-acetyltransferase [Candidatus Thorarchaeota archaeon]